MSRAFEVRRLGVAPLILENPFMSFRMFHVGCFAIAISVGSMATKSLQAQYPNGPSCAGGFSQSYFGQQSFGQLGFGQTGGFQNPGSNYVSNYYGAQPMYAPQPSMGYGGGYPSPAVNLNQSFYPGSYGNSSGPQYQHQPSHHSHHSHHGWHPGHYLLGL